MKAPRFGGKTSRTEGARRGKPILALSNFVLLAPARIEGSAPPLGRALFTWLQRASNIRRFRKKLHWAFNAFGLGSGAGIRVGLRVR